MSAHDTLNLLGQRMRDYRLSMSLTQSKMAREINVELASISNWERGRFLPRLVYLARFADFIGEPLSVFFGQAKAVHDER